MKKINLVILSIGIILFLDSCKDKNSNEFFAGKMDDVLYIDLNPDMDFSYPKKKDSIDINQDLKYEVFLETVDYAGETGFISLPAVKSTSDLSILIAGKDNMPAALSSGETFSNSGKWSTTETVIQLYYFEYVSPNYYKTIGYWKDQQDKYLGIKYKDKLGWIKISTTPGFKIKEIGLEK